ncbi:hypothetical protein MJH12_06930 [bacterium]|nr:hypothetical protein [bacterium]
MKKFAIIGLLIFGNSLVSNTFAKETPKVFLNDVVVAGVEINKYSIPGGSYKCIDALELKLSAQQITTLKSKSPAIFKSIEPDEDGVIEIVLGNACTSGRGKKLYSWLKKHKSFFSSTSKHGLMMNGDFFSNHKYRSYANEAGEGKSSNIISSSEFKIESPTFKSKRGFVNEDGKIEYNSKFDAIYSK